MDLASLPILKAIALSHNRQPQFRIRRSPTGEFIQRTPLPLLQAKAQKLAPQTAAIA
ncbi:hypothetical protein [Synechococcus sp. PCC 7336]|uniref:hypothetical protein n=1 Tax=Synechococcus sp. PCC 7336 TaxID=195250 RepID=UPI001D0CFE7B|nr:hypothetical protein [Synechococcus sp. PCC 7336]